MREAEIGDQMNSRALVSMESDPIDWIEKIFTHKIVVATWKRCWFMKIDEIFKRKHTADCKRVRPTRAQLNGAFK